MLKGEIDEAAAMDRFLSDIRLAVDLSQAHMNLVVYTGAFVPTLARQEKDSEPFENTRKNLELLFEACAVSFSDLLPQCTGGLRRHRGSMSSWEARFGG